MPVDYLFSGATVWPRPEGVTVVDEVAIWTGGGGGGSGDGTNFGGGGAGSPCLVLLNWQVGASGFSLDISLGGTAGSDSAGEDSGATTVTDIDQTYAWIVPGQAGGGQASGAIGIGGATDSSGMDAFIGVYTVYTARNGNNGDDGSGGGAAADSDASAGGDSTRNDGGHTTGGSELRGSPGGGGDGFVTSNGPDDRANGGDGLVRITYTVAVTVPVTTGRPGLQPARSWLPWLNY